MKPTALLIIALAAAACHPPTRVTTIPDKPVTVTFKACAPVPNEPCAPLKGVEIHLEGFTAPHYTNAEGVVAFTLSSRRGLVHSWATLAGYEPIGGHVLIRQDDFIFDVLLYKTRAPEAR